jgi:hypothetical protein
MRTFQLVEHTLYCCYAALATHGDFENDLHAVAQVMG